MNIKTGLKLSEIKDSSFRKTTSSTALNLLLDWAKSLPSTTSTEIRVKIDILSGIADNSYKRWDVYKHFINKIVSQCFRHGRLTPVRSRPSKKSPGRYSNPPSINDLIPDYIWQQHAINQVESFKNVKKGDE